jgi:3-hydroxybutyryl-CoA dehydrogenase
MNPAQHIGVVGAGVMGSGIAQACLVAGLSVVMIDVDQERITRGRDVITGGLERLLKKSKLSAADRDQALARLRGTTDYAALGDCDFVIEAATEKEALKLAILRQIDDAARNDAILATNTSSISIGKLAAATRRPQAFVGLHFFPSWRLSRSCTVREPTGRRYGEGIAAANDIDEAMKLGCNHPIGPLALCDLIGLDVVLAVMQVFHRDFNDPKYRPAPLLEEMVAAGRLGRKSGRGFYTYEEKSRS